MNILVFAFHGILCFQFLAALIQYFITGKKDFLFYSLYICFVFAYFIGRYHYHVDFSTIEEQKNFWLTRLIGALPNFIFYSYAAFVSSFLNLSVAAPTLQRFIRHLQHAVLYYIAIYFILLFFFRYEIPVAVYHVFGSALLIASVFCLIKINALRSRYTKYILAGSFSFLLGAIASTIVMFASRDRNWMSEEYAFVVFYTAAVLEMIFFTMGLLYKLVNIEKDKNEAAILLLKKENENQALQFSMNEMRNKISADLHDQVGSTLYSVSLYSQMAIDKLKSQGEAAQTQNILERIDVASKTMLTEMNDIVWTINPLNDSGQKLSERMKATANSLLAPANIHTSVEINLSGFGDKASMLVRKNIYLIYKEALTNIAKYSGAKNVNIQINSHNSKFSMFITDDGKGFDIMTTTGGNGLLNMHKRSNEINGQLEITSIIDKGTTVFFSLPIIGDSQ